MVQEPGVKNYFKAPEGRYTLHSDRSAFCSFNFSKPIRLSFASIQHQGSTQQYVIYNMLDGIAIAPYAHTDKVCSAAPLVISKSIAASHIHLSQCNDFSTLSPPSPTPFASSPPRTNFSSLTDVIHMEI